MPADQTPRKVAVLRNDVCTMNLNTGIWTCNDRFGYPETLTAHRLNHKMQELEYLAHPAVGDPLDWLANEAVTALGGNIT